MAFATGVRDAQLFRQHWIGNVETVVAALVSAHVGGVGHVARDTGTASAVRAVLAVRERVDQRSSLDPAIGAGAVTRHAKRVVFQRQFELGGVWVVAVHAVDALVPHFTQTQRGPNVVLVLDLAVGVIQAILGRQL